MRNRSKEEYPTRHVIGQATSLSWYLRHQEIRRIADARQVKTDKVSSMILALLPDEYQAVAALIEQLGESTTPGYLRHSSHTERTVEGRNVVFKYPQLLPLFDAWMKEDSEEDEYFFDRDVVDMVARLRCLTEISGHLSATMYRLDSEMLDCSSVLEDLEKEIAESRELEKLSIEEQIAHTFPDVEEADDEQ